ncbi:MAG: sensor histidine kinase [Oscillospiraceae bacterium]
MAAKKSRHLRSMTVVTVSVCVFALIMLGIAVTFMYQYTEQSYNALFVEKSLGYAENVSAQLLSGKSFLDGSDRPSGFWEYRTLSAIHTTNYRSLSHESFNRKTAQESKNATPVQTAVLVQDAQGNTLFQSGNFLYFQYSTENTWKAGGGAEPDGYGWTALGTDTQSALYRSMKKLSETTGISDLRITGYWDGTELIPCSIDYVTYQAVIAARDVYRENGGTLTAGRVAGLLDNAGYLEWQNAFACDPGSEGGSRVTLYADDFTFNFYDPGGALTCGGEEYDNLLAWAGSGTFQDGITYEKNSIFTVKRQTVLVTDGTGAEEYMVITAVCGEPWRAEMNTGRTVIFLMMLLLTAGAVALLLWLIKRNLVEPVKVINAGISDDWDTVWFADELSPKWRELYELHLHYEQTKDDLFLKKDEITRLNKALNYARLSEKNRRQMVSALAHELKTPLAVIHSYAEGLKEDIARSKREKYLNVILTETEHMDGMVREMLDLSRLEAGRVQLSRSEFSLSELARSVFERLAMAADTKGLRVEFRFPDNCTVTADEARIRQGVENFAANAVKYTPANGSIRVEIDTNRFETTFSVENDSAPLSDEVLAKVWDTFYRSDESRPGAGLGLAIAKSIVELHGGKCSVQNTESGVRFQFTI